MKIVLGISSGIAAYKIPELAENLIEKGHDVHVVMTAKSTHLTSPEEMEKITGNHVSVDLFDTTFSKKRVLKERKVDHIELAKSADLIVIAPATANTVANLASGKADDFLNTTVLATRAPILVCPSMNDQMWLHPAVQENIYKLESYGYIVMTPESGSLACGTEGIGRLPAIKTISEEIEALLATRNSLKGKRVIITAGGTSESIDSVRVITNRSSGKMGIALAEECYRRGADVLLLRSQSSQKVSTPVKQITFRSAADLSTLIKQYVVNYDIIIHTAAVSDFTIVPFKGKIDSDQSITLTLKPTEKIINNIKKWNPTIELIGFKAIHGSIEQNSNKIKTLLAESKSDYIVINDISRDDIGLEVDENEVSIVNKDGFQETIKKMTKKKIAGEIINRIKI
ncbi:bifunctional phosphopantothenoylcysteine decarboxylase/phosphopantothenate--cysteine ligase CoaBC [soil metagenome]